MLQSNFVSFPIDVAKIEQTRSDDRAHDTVFGSIRPSDGTRFRIGKVDPVTPRFDSHRLSEQCALIVSVPNVLATGAAVNPRFSCGCVDRPYLMRAGHRDIESFSDQRHVPRRRHGARLSVRARPQLSSRSGNCPQVVLNEIEGADGVILRVRDVERVA